MIEMLKSIFSKFIWIFKVKEAPSPDKLGLYPEKVEVKAIPERRYLWTTRVIVIITSVSICMSIITASILFLLIPQIRAYPGIYYIDKDTNEFKPLEPYKIKLNSLNLITEMNIGLYIKLRNTVKDDIEYMTLLWSEDSELKWFSTGSVFNDGKEEIKEGLEAGFNGYSRECKINWIKSLGRNDWLADIYTYDKYPDYPNPEIKHWNVLITANYPKAKEMSQKERNFNPYNFKISSYKMAYKGKIKGAFD